MENEAGLVTVIIPVYNAAPYLRESIDSILRQSYKNLSVFICNDCSTDRSGSILDQYNDPRIRRFNNATNLGYLRSVNLMMAHSRSAFVAFHDADDISHPDRIRQQVEFLNAHRDIDLVGTNYSLINEKGEVLTTYPSMLADPEIIGDAMMASNVFQKPSVLFRRRVYERLGGFREGFLQMRNISEDYDWLLQASEAFLLSNVNGAEPLYLYRSVATAMSKNYKSLDQHVGHKMARFLACERRMNFGTDSLMRRDFHQIEKQLELFKIPYEDDTSLFYFEKAEALLYNGLHRQALRMALIAFVRRPFKWRNLRCLLSVIKRIR